MTQEEAVSALPSVAREPVHCAIEERLSCVMHNDGGLKELSVVGEFKLTITDKASDKIVLQLAHNDEATGIQFKTHPNVNKVKKKEEKKTRKNWFLIF